MRIKHPFTPQQKCFTGDVSWRSAVFQCAGELAVEDSFTAEPNAHPPMDI